MVNGMKKQKSNYQTEEQKEMMYFLIILGVVFVFVFVVYYFSKFFVVDQSLFEPNYTAGVVNEERAIVGTIFNRPESEYYVIAYDETSSKAVYYSALSTTYGKDGTLNIYHLDLSNSLNQSYYVGSDGESNQHAKKASEIKLKDLTLIKIKNGKIEKYLEKLEDIEKELATK